MAEVRRFWWVNQNQTHKEEIAGGFLWSPKRNANGARNQFYDNMREVAPGDVVLSFYGARIQAVGIAATRAEAAPKPDFSRGGQVDKWADEGWLVRVEFAPLGEPPRPKDHMDRIRPLLPPKYSPLQVSGDGLQSVYLAEIPQELADLLVGIGGGYPETASLAFQRAVERAIDQINQLLTTIEHLTERNKWLNWHLIAARAEIDQLEKLRDALSVELRKPNGPNKRSARFLAAAGAVILAVVSGSNAGVSQQLAADAVAQESRAPAEQLLSDIDAALRACEEVSGEVVP